ncbi:MAG: S8 family serine peptidase, partial [Muribaculaceae bacterium]|nr:S8 family serine peptidase [Muribaculaceae bacterium]
RFGGTAQIADAIQYIFDYADEVDKPCVINMSLGAHQGPHDGTSDLDRVIDASVGPGRIIVGAVGNEGAANMHAGKTFTDDDTVLKAMLANNSKEARIDVWGDPGADIKLSVGITNAAKGTIVAESRQYTADDGEVDFGFNYEQTLADVSFSIYPSRTPDNRSNFLIIVYGGSKYFADSRKVFIKVEGPSGSSVHMWNIAAEDFAITTRQGWTSGDNKYTAGEVGGTAKRIISVGSFNSRNTLPYYLYPEAGDDAIDCGQLFGNYTLEAISDFSSRGPTIDGRMKPDVCAGGMPVVSSISQYCQDLTMPFDPSNCIARTQDSAGKYHYYSIDAGTSMASPAVAGIVAMWLEANPELTPEMVSEVLRKTSSVDRYTGSRGNNNAGYGKVHALNGVRYVLKGEFEGAGLEAVASAGRNSRAWAADGILSVVSPVAGTVTLTSVSGARLLSVPVEAGLSDVDACSVARGIYVVTLPDGTNIKVAL